MHCFHCKITVNVVKKQINQSNLFVDILGNHILLHNCHIRHKWCHVHVTLKLSLMKRFVN